jgi:hypothetical protein
MNTAKQDSVFVRLFKSLLIDAGFRCRGSKCTASRGDLEVELSFRNRWGWQVPDIYISVSDNEAGALLQDDIRFLFPGYRDFRAEFSDEVLLEMAPDTESRTRAVLAQEVIPEAVDLTARAHFLRKIDEGRFSGSAIHARAIAKLRESN